MFIPKISTHLEFGGFSHSFMNLGTLNVMVSPMMSTIFGSVSGMDDGYPKTVPVDLTALTLREIYVEIDIPEHVYLLFDKSTGNLRIACRPEGIKAKVESKEHKNIVFNGTADDIIIGLRGDILEVIDLVGFRMTAEWKSDVIDLPALCEDVKSDHVNSVKRWDTPYRIIGSRVITTSVSDGGRIEDAVINYLNNEILPKYLP